jgi:hypothetical protein
MEIEIMTIKEITDALSFGKEKKNRELFHALMCKLEQLEAFVDYFIAKKTSSGESGNLQLEADSPELREKLIAPAITALQLLDQKYVSILPSPFKRDWTQTDSKLRFIVQFVLACRRPFAIWHSEPDNYEQVHLTREILKILENEFSEPQIKKSELARRMDRAARTQLLDFDFGVGRDDEDGKLEVADRENEAAFTAEAEAIRQACYPS